jgi:EF hand
MKAPLTLALAALLSTAAFAQTPPSGAGSSVFDQFDSDHDGRITQTEAQINSTVVANFKTADSDADGNLSKSEFDAAFKPSSSPTPPPADKPQSEQAPAPSESPSSDMPPADQTTPPSAQPPQQ